MQVAAQVKSWTLEGNGMVRVHLPGSEKRSGTSQHQHCWIITTDGVCMCVFVCVCVYVSIHWEPVRVAFGLKAFPIGKTINQSKNTSALQAMPCSLWKTCNALELDSQWCELYMQLHTHIIPEVPPLKVVFCARRCPCSEQMMVLSKCLLACSLPAETRTECRSVQHILTGTTNSWRKLY